MRSIGLIKKKKQANNIMITNKVAIIQPLFVCVLMQ